MNDASARCVVCQSVLAVAPSAFLQKHSILRHATKARELRVVSITGPRRSAEGDLIHFSLTIETTFPILDYMSRLRGLYAG